MIRGRVPRDGGWGTDNTLSRGLAERDPGQAVLGKAAIGAIPSSGIAWLLTEPRPAVASSLALRHGRAHVSDAHHRHPH